MKKCPQCQTDYFDNMLDFCLEDGARLILAEDDPPSKPAARTIFQESPPTDPSTIAFNSAFRHPRNDSEGEIETVVVEKTPGKTPGNNIGQVAEKNAGQNTLQAPRKLDTEKIRHRALGHWTSFLETAPLVLALMHNYWQWLYLSKLGYSGFLEYFLSGSFLIWITLLICGLILSIVSLKYGRSLKFAVFSLVVLAINVLLYIVPK